MARVRQSIEYLQNEYLKGNTKPLDKLMTAWRGIQDKSTEDPTDPNGFFALGGFHGEPFHGAGATSSDGVWWGGYCNHGNVLFPTWHRAYIWRLENALRSIEGCEDVTLPFWDEYSYYDPKAYEPTDDAAPGDPVTGSDPAKAYGRAIPAVFTEEFWPPGQTVTRNPLRSYKFPRPVVDAADGKNRYDKGKDYETVRFPYSGLVGTPEDREKTTVWNNKFKPEEAVGILNENVYSWLNQGVVVTKDKTDKARIPDTTSVGARYKACLNAPNYMVFSNKTSAQQYMTDREIDPNKHIIVSLEDPHNAIHLAVGGFYQQNVYKANPEPYDDANGDMGENNTAGLDPIFFFHHCFIDYTFWSWQRKSGLTKRGALTVDWGYAGTNSADGGTPAFSAANVPIDMDTPLYPFKNEDKTWVTSHDVTDIEKIGYSYGQGSLDPLVDPPKHFAGAPHMPSTPAKILKVSNISRVKYEGSFVIRTVIRQGDKEVEVGREPILSRWKVSGCRNCQNHLETRSFVPLHQELLDQLDEELKHEDIHVVIQTHHGRTESRAALLSGLDDGEVQPRVEIL